MKHTDTGRLYKACTRTAMRLHYTLFGDLPALSIHARTIHYYRHVGYAENEPVLYTIADNHMLVSIGMLHSAMTNI